MYLLFIFFITLIFIALYEYCIESPSIQFTHRNLVYYVPLKKKKEELSFKGGQIVEKWLGSMWRDLMEGRAILVGSVYANSS